MQKAWMSWSSGKDSAFALLEAEKLSDIEVTSLLTTVNETHCRVAMHAVRDQLLALAEEMIRVGQSAVITCVDPKKLSKDFVGREFDLSFLEALPPGVDPCGENGEFHSENSPVFSMPEGNGSHP